MNPDELPGDTPFWCAKHQNARRSELRVGFKVEPMACPMCAVEELNARLRDVWLPKACLTAHIFSALRALQEGCHGDAEAILLHAVEEIR